MTPNRDWTIAEGGRKMSDIGITYLEKNRLLHIAMLESIRRDKALILHESEHGMLMLDQSSNVHMVSADNDEYGKYLVDEIRNPYQIVVCQESLADYAESEFQLHDVFKCKKVAYFKGQKVSFVSDLQIERPDAGHLQMIKENYHTIPEEEIDEINGRGNLFCALHADNFVGFSGCHLDGSLGLLEIFPAFQRRGFGEELKRFMINYILEKGDTPYGEIVIGNEASAKLQKKLGFEISKETITWLL